MPHPSTKFIKSIGYNNVVYDNKQFRDDLYDYFYSSILQEGKSAWLTAIRTNLKHYSAFIKNGTFHDEREIRIVFYPSNYTRYIIILYI